MDWRDGGRFFSEGMLMGACHRCGGGGLQERHVHRKFLCGSLSVALATLQWRPYRHNGHGGRGHDEGTHSAHSPAHNEQLQDVRENEFTCTLYPQSLRLFCYFSFTSFLHLPLPFTVSVRGSHWTSLHNVLHFTGRLALHPTIRLLKV